MSQDRKHYKWLEYSPSKRLDDILDWLAMPPKTYNGMVTLDSITNFVIIDKSKNKISEDEARVAIDFLIEEGFVYSKPQPLNQLNKVNTHTVYGITYKGLIFQQSGGYGEEINRKNAEHSKLELQLIEEKNERKKDNSKKIKHFYLSVALGGLIGWCGTLFQRQPEPLKLNFPKIQIVHDTVYIPSNKKAKDTSLVRIVKVK